jgi:hypothetical protein
MSAEGLFNLVQSAPPTLKYEHGRIVADGAFVIVHGGCSATNSAAELLVT